MKRRVDQTKPEGTARRGMVLFTCDGDDLQCRRALVFKSRSERKRRAREEFGDGGWTEDGINHYCPEHAGCADHRCHESSCGADEEG